MRIFITGDLGYVGAALLPHLRCRRRDAELIGCDGGFFAADLACGSRPPETALDAQLFADVRDLPAQSLQGVDAVVHLAAISNDPIGARFEAVTEAVNAKATLRLAEIARDQGVKRFVFASSCSLYGAAPGPARKEGDPLNPLTAYARSKAAVEAALAAMPLGDMQVTCLRFATACGFSPRLRLDLVLNDFVAGALATGKVSILSDGAPWRPLIDVADMARAIDWALDRDDAAGGRRLSVNVGQDEANRQVRDLAEAVAAEIEGVTVSVNPEAAPDARSYRVDFSLYRALAPAHQPQVSLAQSVRSLRQGLSDAGFADPNYRASRFVRLRALEAHIAAGRLSEDLRWRWD